MDEIVNADKPDDTRDEEEDLVVAPVVPGPRKPSLAMTMAAWAPVAAGVLRSVAGMIAFAAALLTLPIHMATPFLSGVGLLMVVGGAVAVTKACRGERQLRWFAVFFPCFVAACVSVVAVVVYVKGPGAFAPNLHGAANDSGGRSDEGVVRFESR